MSIADRMQLICTSRGPLWSTGGIVSLLNIAGEEKTHLRESKSLQLKEDREQVEELRAEERAVG